MAGNPSTCVSPYGFGGSGKLDKRSPYEEEVMKQNIVMEVSVFVPAWDAPNLLASCPTLWACLFFVMGI